MFKPLYGLSCSGGGAQGAYQVGVLKYIYEHFSEGNKSPFQVYSGTSIGSINTTFCASYSFDAETTRNLMEELWMSFDVPPWHGHIFFTFLKSLSRHWLRLASGKKSIWSLLDSKPLRDIIQKSFFRENLERAFEEKTTRGLSVSTTEVLSGKTCWFMEGPDIVPWNFLRSLAVEEKIQLEHVQASCSAPILFPPIKIGGHFFVDGSASVKTPFNPIVNMGARRILSIATDKPLPSHLPKYPPNLKPKFGNLFRMLEHQFSYNYAIEQAGTLKFINYFSEQLRGHKRMTKSPPTTHLFDDESIFPENYQTTDVYLFFPSRRIRQSSVYPLSEELVGVSKKTKFLFTREFTSQLIKFGYQDAKNRHEKLEEFFNPTSPRGFSRFFSVKDWRK